MKFPKGRGRSGIHAIWKLSLLTFILAAATGSLFRFAMIGVLPGWFSLENLRHAHSHLMFFSWAVPVPLYFALYKYRLLGYSPGPIAGMKRWLLATILLGLAAYPFFLMYGYRSVPIGTSTIPFSVILSGLVMISWYGFIYHWMRNREGMPSTISVRLYDAALLLLLISSLGAWGVAATQFLQVGNPLYGKALTHFFLSTFTEGWCVTVLLGVLYQHLEIKADELSFSANWLILPILFGAPLTFPYGISDLLLTGEMLLAARLGGALAAGGLLLNLYFLLRHGQGRWSLIWKIPLWLLALKAATQLAASVLPGSFWMSDHPLRIFYLHLLLLGGFTLTMFATLHQRSQILPTTYYLFAGSVLLVLFSLLIMTRYWPAGLSWADPHTFAAVVSALPVLAAGLDYYRLIK